MSTSPPTPFLLQKGENIIIVEQRRIGLFPDLDYSCWGIGFLARAHFVYFGADKSVVITYNAQHGQTGIFSGKGFG